jgi:hypothetical protein
MRRNANLYWKVLTKKGVRRRDGNSPNDPDSVFVRNQVGRGDDADAAPELNNALHPVFAMSERPGSVYAVFTVLLSARLTYPCLRLRQAS